MENNVLYKNIPTELQALKQWVNWRYEDDGGKKTKPPLSPGNGRKASVRDPSTWATFDAAKGYHDNGGKTEGVGLVLTADDNFIGVDLDNCFDPQTGALLPHAKEIIESLNSYTELSPSGKGIRIIVKGKLPKSGFKNTEHGVELYASRRYLTITGKVIYGRSIIHDRHPELDELIEKYFISSSSPLDKQAPHTADDTISKHDTVLSDDELLERAMNAGNSKKFKSLWAGDTLNHNGDASSADLSLCTILAYWSKDPAQIDRLFRQSGLIRPKWDEVHYGDGRSYGQVAIAKALSFAMNSSQTAAVNSPVVVNTGGERSQVGEALLEFPLEVMSGVAADFANTYGGRLESPKQFLYVSFLTCLGSVLADAITISTEIVPQPRLYTLLLGESADERKSTAINKTSVFFDDALKGTQLPNLIACWGVGSAEGLQKRFKQDKRVLLCLDEMKNFVSKATSDGSVLLPCVNTLFESNSTENQTKNSSMVIKEAYLSILAASTKATYDRTWHASFTDIGFNNRIFLVTGSAKRQFSFPEKVPQHEKDALSAELIKVITWALTLQNPVLDINDAAKAIYHEWYMKAESSVHCKRLDTYALRFMILLALNEMKNVIDEEIVGRVIKLMDWQLQVRKIYDPIDADNKVAKIEEKVRRQLSLGPRTERELRQRVNIKKVGLWFLDTALKNLKKAGEIEAQGNKGKLWSLVA